ncbi:hypothetical protein A2U01_0099436, partial [Trifolium medium]|nr:hypothetical protein [Trifolium medium]
NKHLNHRSKEVGLQNLLPRPSVAAVPPSIAATPPCSGVATDADLLSFDADC